VDERLVQLSDPPDICGSPFAPENIANLKAWCQYHPQDGVMTGLQNAIGPQ
jgi:hypothetical protein